MSIAYSNADLKPQDGATEVFDELKEKGILVILNTGYNQATAIDILEKLNWKEGETFDGLVTANHVINNRPEPDMILLAMERFGITDAREVVKVGDSIIDIEEGKNAGCVLTVGITTGAHTYEQLVSANPNAVIHRLTDLLPLLN
ncbi:MAG: HAD-IA family hydrolase [Ferruginibacter sp.]